MMYAPTSTLQMISCVFNLERNPLLKINFELSADQYDLKKGCEIP